MSLDSQLEDFRKETRRLSNQQAEHMNAIKTGFKEIDACLSKAACSIKRISIAIIMASAILVAAIAVFVTR